jgi:hypothetical protein
MRNNMKKLDLIRCIKQGFIDGTNDRLNEDNEDYEESCTTLDIVGIEAQYSYEFGLMMAGKRWILKKKRWMVIILSKYFMIVIQVNVYLSGINYGNIFTIGFGILIAFGLVCVLQMGE